MKTLKRKWINSYERIEDARDGNFICIGQWADNHLAYSLLDDNGKIIPEDDGMFVQVRENGHLLMVRL